MIAKVSTGRSFGGTIRYLFEGHQHEQADKRAELLDYNGIRPSMNEMIRDFNFHRLLNRNLGNAVGHISISYHPNDMAKATDQAMTQHARQLMVKMDIDPDLTQWALVRHRDRNHEHFHLVYNRVDYNGKTISDAHNYKRSHEATRAIALEYGLTVAVEKKKDLGLTHQKRLPGNDQARYQIYQAITQTLPQSNSIAELKKALHLQGIETKVQKNGQGMSFKLGEHAFKASEVDRQYTGGKLHAQIEQNQQLQAKQQRKAEQRIARATYIRQSHQQLKAHRQSRTATNERQAEQAHQRNTVRQQSKQQDLLKGFGALADIMKQRDQQKTFGQLADIMKQRDQSRQQELTKEQSGTKQQNPKRDQSRGLGR